MKKIFSLGLLMALLSLSFLSCVPSGSNGNSQVVVQEAKESIGDNLNLQAVGEVVKSSKTPQEIEQKLNADDGINNLDLDGDGNRDYLKVTEYGSGSNHGYSICAVLTDGEPEVAKVEVDTNTKQLTLNGNQQYYGDNNVYQSNFDATDFLLMAYLLQPHYSYYHSPYYYGHYGYGYSHRPVVAYHSYSTRPVVRSTTRTVYRSVPSKSYTSKISSPNTHNKSTVASKRSSSFSKPTTSQKSFKTNSGSSTHKSSSAFGNKSNTKSSTPSRSSSSSSKSSSSRSSSSSHRR